MRQKQIVLLSASALIVSVLLFTIYVVIIRKRHQIAELTAQYEIKIAQLEEAKQELENPDKFESKEERWLEEELVIPVIAPSRSI